ncbi:MAG TPA: glycine betaine ABC transporter substrate-binding protein [Candidatus Polarisedimenticolia bacterium]|jgi:osmoprotectant transport system permease protein|nr:glycine betaine ABC transporter substrate-binding protein [Candidatus Polarisedimenticolia bacterium]
MRGARATWIRFASGIGLLALVVSALVTSACRTSPAGGALVRVGSKKFTESVVLGEILTQMMNNAGVRSEHRAQLGGTQVLWHALRHGDIDLYTEYTGTLRADILRDLPDGSEESLRAALARFEIGMSASLGFEDKYALGMKGSDARRLGVARISDLGAQPRLRFGFSEEFLNRADGWPLVRKRYDLPQTDVRPLDHDLAYRALAGGDLDVTDLYTTDAEIPYYDLTVLDDDLHLFPDYQAVVLYRLDLSRRVPAALDAVRALEGRITAAGMQRLNARVKMERVPERAAAAEFLAATLHLSNATPREGRAQRVGRALAEHLRLVGASLFAAVVVAIPLGIAAARRRRLGAAILAVAGVVQTIPTLALLVLLIPLLGIGALPAVAALFLYSVLPIVTNTMAGLDGIPASLLESADVLGLSRGARLRMVELPLASPSILAGVQTSAVINVGTATLGALIGAGGLGQPILTGIRLDDMRLILEGAVPSALLALVVQALFAWLARILVPRGLRR